MPRCHENRVGKTLITISVLQLCAAIPLKERVARQANMPSTPPQTMDVKILNAGQSSINRPPTLPNFVTGDASFASVVPFDGGQYGLLGYTGSPAMGVLGMQFGSGAGARFPGFTAPLQMGGGGAQPAGLLGYPPTMDNFIGSHLPPPPPPYPINAADLNSNNLLNGFQNNVGANVMGGAPNLDMIHPQGIAGLGSQSTTPMLGTAVQQPQLQLQAQASQLQPQIVPPPYPFAPTPFYGPFNGYGAAF